jgi:hypothetical protein
MSGRYFKAYPQDEFRTVPPFNIMSVSRIVEAHLPMSGENVKLSKSNASSGQLGSFWETDLFPNARTFLAVCRSAFLPPTTSK